MWECNINAGMCKCVIQVPHKYRTSSSVINLNPDSKFYKNNEDIIDLVRVIGNDELSISQMMDIKKTQA